MTDQTPVLKRIWDGDTVDPKDIQALVDGIARRFDSQPTRKIVEFTALYTEPMFVKFDRIPAGITCLRVRLAAALEVPVLCGTQVAWIWDGTNGRAQLSEIDGMATGSGNNFVFTLEAVFPPVVT